MIPRSQRVPLAALIVALPLTLLTVPAKAQTATFDCGINGLPMTVVPAAKQSSTNYTCVGENTTGTLTNFWSAEIDQFGLGAGSINSWTSVTEPNGSVTHDTGSNQANVAYRLHFMARGNTSVSNKVVATARSLRILPTGREWFNPRVTTPTIWSPDGRAYRTVRTNTTTTPNLLDHFWQSANIIANPISSIGAHALDAIEKLGFAAPDLYAGFKTNFANNSDTDVSSYSEMANNLAVKLRATSGFTNFANARVTLGDKTIGWLNCSGTVSTGIGSCAVIVQYLDQASGKSVTYQGPATTIASSSADVAMAFYRTDERKTTSDLMKMGVMNPGVIPEPRAPKAEDFPPEENKAN
ncbi:hypothetical protein K8Q93_02555 [Candidatus Parcubacteria bacterium]|nr:hypothetical protein [Candidatus Parcubacteria bacterium]